MRTEEEIQKEIDKLHKKVENMEDSISASEDPEETQRLQQIKEKYRHTLNALYWVVGTRSFV